MASNIKTLKEDNGDIVYPQTLTGAVYTSNNTALDTELAKYVTAEDIATTATSFGAITTGMIADDAITTAKIDDGAVTAAKLDPSVLTFGSYSTSEVDTGFTWIDGKHIYKKTINFGTLPNNTTKNVAHSITNLEYVVRIEGTILQGTVQNGNFKPIPLLYASGDSSYNTECYVDKNDISMRCSNNRVNCTAYVTIYYTKSS